MWIGSSTQMGRASELSEVVLQSLMTSQNTIHKARCSVRHARIACEPWHRCLSGALVFLCGPVPQLLDARKPIAAASLAHAVYHANYRGSNRAQTAVT